MTYMEYMNEHPDENFTWCKPYTNDSEDCYLIMYDGEAQEIHSPGIDAYRYDGSLRLHMEEFARLLAGNDYDLYKGYTDEHIALQYMHECGCASCPSRHACETMLKEMEDTDYR